MKIQQPPMAERVSNVSFWSWLLNLVKVVNFNATILGPFTNDADAAAHGIAIGSLYYLSTGAVVIRLV